MGLMPVKNFAEAVMANGITAAGPTVTVKNGQTTNLSNPNTEGQFEAVIWDATQYPSPHLDPLHEIVLVRSLSGNVYSVTRGQGGTMAVDHVEDHEYHIGQFLTAKMFGDINTALQASPSTSRNYTLGTSIPSNSVVRLNNLGYLLPISELQDYIYDWYLDYGVTPNPTVREVVDTGNNVFAVLVGSSDSKQSSIYLIDCNSYTMGTPIPGLTTISPGILHILYDTNRSRLLNFSIS